MITFMPWSPILILNLQSATRKWDFLQVICISFHFIYIAQYISATGQMVRGGLLYRQVWINNKIIKYK